MVNDWRDDQDPGPHQDQRQHDRDSAKTIGERGSEDDGGETQSGDQRLPPWDDNIQAKHQRLAADLQGWERLSRSTAVADTTEPQQT